MDNRFEAALSQARAAEHPRDGIGTLSERTLHAVLKQYYEPHADAQEVQIGGYIADIVGEDGIIEIQTKQLFRLRKKLEAFLSVGRVTVVYPLIVRKFLIRSDRPDKRRKSPVHRTLYDAFAELYGIRELLLHENLTVRVCLLEVEEIRDPNVKSRSWRGRPAKVDTVPTALLGEYTFRTRDDYLRLVPDGLPPAFTSLDFATRAGITRDAARHMLNTLTATGLFARVGKAGNSILFSCPARQSEAERR